MAISELPKSDLTSGQLARLAGVSPDTLRHYERKGVLPQPDRSENGYRRYPSDALQRVLMVRQALNLGFTLDELAVFVQERDRGGAPCRRLRAMAATKLTEVEARIRDMEALRDVLTALLADWDRSLETTPLGTRARLLEFLIADRQDPANSTIEGNES